MNRNVKISFVSFFITFALLFPVAAVLMSSFAGRPEETQQADGQVEYRVPKEQDLTLLLMVQQQAGKPYDVFLLLQISPHDNRVSGCALPADTVTVVGSKRGSLSEFAATAAQARQAVEVLTGIQADRTLRAGNDGFAQMVDFLGGVEVTLSHPVGPLASGRQMLDGARACVLLRTDPLLVAGALGQRLTAQTDAGRLLTLVGDCCETDLTAYDMAVHKDGWRQMMENHTAAWSPVALQLETVGKRQRLTARSRQQLQAAFGNIEN